MADLLGGGTATVTGGASGIGRATAVAFARDGCSNILLGDLSVPGMEETRGIIFKSFPETKVEICKIDISNEDDVSSFHELAIAKFGRIDFAANIAGYAGKAAPITETPESEYNKLYEVNQRGVFLCQRAQLRQMIKQEPLEGFESRGSIVNIASLCSTIAMPSLSAYSASKAGILMLTKVDALDFGPHKIRINCVSPGNVLTNMVKEAMGDEHLTHFAKITPWRRLAYAEDIANTIVWLSSPRAQYITGINLPVDGGLNLSTGPP